MGPCRNTPGNIQRCFQGETFISLREHLILCIPTRCQRPPGPGPAHLNNRFIHGHALALAPALPLALSNTAYGLPRGQPHGYSTLCGGGSWMMIHRGSSYRTRPLTTSFPLVIQKHAPALLPTHTSLCLDPPLNPPFVWQLCNKEPHLGCVYDGGNLRWILLH